jgi:hypothetical protein
MPDPINYLAASPPVDFTRNILSGLQTGAQYQQIQMAQQQQQLAMQRQQQYQAATADAIANPTPAKFSALAVQFPEHREAYKQAWEGINADQQQTELRDASQLASMLHQGRTDLAIPALESRIAAAKNSNQPTGQYDALLDAVKTDPTQAYAATLHAIAGMPGGDKVLVNLGALGDEMRKQGKAPIELREAGAKATVEEAKAANAPRSEAAAADKAVSDATTAQAQANNAPALYSAQAGKAGSEATTAAVTATNAPEAARLDLKLKGLQGQNISSEMNDRVKRFKLDSDRFASEMELKTRELQNKLGELPEPVAKEVNTATVNAIAAQQTAEKLTNMAGMFDQYAGRMGSGWKGALDEMVKAGTLNKNDITMIRANYGQLATQSALSAYRKLAPGTTSDKDIETAMKGWPKDTDPPELISSYLRGVAKLHVYESVSQNAQSEWQGLVHSLGTAKTDISIDGVKVPAGTTFKQFSDQYVPRKMTDMLKASTEPTGINPQTGQKIKLVNGQWVPA